MPRNSNAREVAKKVIEQVKSGKRPNIKEAALKSGYSSTTATKHAKQITEQKAYREVIFDFEKELDERIKDANEIMQKKKGKATFRDGLEAMDKLKKLKRLINDESTENKKVNISGLLDNLEEDGE